MLPQPAAPYWKDRSKGKKKEAWVQSGIEFFAFRVDGCFQMTPASCEIVLSLTWQWPAYVQLVQVKV